MDEKELLALKLLTEKKKSLDRTPKKSDFSDEEIMLIKSKLGPFPRALEKAGLKTITKASAAEKSRKKRKKANIRRKRNEE